MLAVAVASMSRPLKTAALSIAGLFVVYLLFAWLAFDPLVRWAVPKVVADRSGALLSIDRARFDPFRLSLDVEGVNLAEADGRPLLAFARLFVDLETSSVVDRAWTFAEVRLIEPVAQLEVRHDGGLNWSRFVDAFNRPGDARLPALLIRHAAVERGRVNFADETVAGGFRTVVEPLDLELNDLSTLPDEQGRHAVSARTSIGARVAWNGIVQLNPLTASGHVTVDDLDLARLWPYLQSTLKMATPQGRAALEFGYAVRYEHKRWDVKLTDLGARLQGLALRGTDEQRISAVALDSVALAGGRLDLQRHEAGIESIAVEGGRLAVARSADGRLSVQDWFGPTAPAAGAAVRAPAAPASAPSSPASPATGEAPWHIGVGRVGIDRLAVRVVDEGFAAPLAAEVDRLKAGFKAEATAVATGPSLRIEGLGVELAGVRLLPAVGGTPLFELARAQLADGQVDLAARLASIGTVALTGGRLAASRDANGEVPLVSALHRIEPDGAKIAVTAVAADTRDPPWRYRIDRATADDFALDLREGSVQPPATVSLNHMHAEVRGLSDELSSAVPVRLALRIGETGRFEAKGTVVPATAAADLQIALADVSLKPAQPYVAQRANLVLVSGTAGSSGRLVYDKGSWRYDGNLDVHDVLLNESDTRERFLAWKSLSTRRFVMTPERLDINELALDRLGAKLVIFPDKTMNLKRIVKAPGPGAAESPRRLATVTQASGYGVRIGRVRVTHGDLDFADLSLALPFGTRGHRLAGELVNLSTQSNRPAQLELQGQVDAYGLARAAGQIDLFDPAGFSDVKVQFRNVEMVTLTPYSATFAGRKIRSGKLSLDLDYKIQKRQLLGENKIVMDQLTLGERVESPSARNLPLDLAIAILRDSDGKIDLGLPVSGSLDDPQFSYGGIIWKAIVNVVTRIVSAPFRALGALFGGSGEEASKVAFEAGESSLLPPEREKLKNLAAGLSKRPGLALTVQPTYDARIDRQALREGQLRRDVATRMGRTLEAGQDPGPITTSDPKVREALEQLFVARHDPSALDELKRQHAQANPAAPADGGSGRVISRLSRTLAPASAPAGEAETAHLKGTDLSELIYTRLLDTEAIEDARLVALGEARGAAIRRGVISNGVADERVRLEAPSASGSVKGEVIATLKLDVAAPAGAPEAAASSAAMAR